MTSPSQIVRRSLANFQKAGNLVAEGRLTEALEPLRQSVQEEPGFPDSLFLLARTERRLALYDQALESLENDFRRIRRSSMKRSNRLYFLDSPPK